MTGGHRQRLGPSELLWVLATAALAYSFMQTLVLPALPAFADAFDADLTSVAWIASGFFLSSSISIPLVGRLGDALGKVRVLTATMAVFGLATLAAAFAPSLEVLIAARVLQGIGGAVFPLAFGIARDDLPPERVAFGIGVISAIFGIGSGVGYVLSGVVLETLGWRWLFILGCLPVLAAVVYLPRIPESPVRAKIRPDWVGAVLLSLGLLAVLVALSEGNRWGWGSARVIALVAAGLAVLALWTWVERRVPDPMVDMTMLARPSMALLNAATFLIGYDMIAVFTILPGFLAAEPAVAGYGFGASSLELGLFFLPLAIGMLVAGPPAGGARRLAPLAVLRIGVVSLAVALALMAVARGEPWMVYAWMALIGAGSAICLAVLGRLVVEAVPVDQSGIAGGMNTIARTIGGAVAGVAGPAMVAAFEGADGTPSARGYTVAFLAGAGVGVVALALTVGLARLRVGSRHAFVAVGAGEPAGRPFTDQTFRR